MRLAKTHEFAPRASNRAMNRADLNLARTAAVMLLLFVFIPFLSLAAKSGASGIRRSVNVSASHPASPAPKLTFRRIFKSSAPEFIEITVCEDADQATY